MQPMCFATDIDARFIRICQIWSGQLIFDSIFKISQRLEGFFVKIENRSFTDRYMKLIGKIILYSVIRDKLKLWHIDRMRFEPCPILNRFCNSFGKSSGKPVAFIVLEYLCPVFRHDSWNINAEDLAWVKAHLTVSSRGQFAAINFYQPNFIWVINFFQCGANMVFLAAGLFTCFIFGLLFPVWIAWWRLAAICAV